jgi:hypothetical protein
MGSRLMYRPISGSKYRNPWLFRANAKERSFVLASRLLLELPVLAMLFPKAS